MIKTMEKRPQRSPIDIPDLPRVVELIKGKVLCDIGCAAGDLTLRFANHSDRVIGIDNDKKRLTKAKKNRNNHGIKNVSFILADATKAIVEKPEDLDADVYYVFGIRGKKLECVVDGKYNFWLGLQNWCDLLEKHMCSGENGRDRVLITFLGFHARNGDISPDLFDEVFEFKATEYEPRVREDPKGFAHDTGVYDIGIKYLRGKK